MSTHTPGPWTAIHNKWPIPHDDDWCVVGEQEEVIATRIGEANARLIAAAPDLLAALKSVVGRYKTNDATMGDDLYRYVCAAIAKAEGVS